MTFNRTPWPPYLFVYDDLLIYKKRRFFVVREMTISYNQISQIILTRGIFFSHMDIVTTGDEHIVVRFLSKNLAKHAKSIIDQKIYHAHAKHQPNTTPVNNTANNFEKSLSRLKELLVKEVITEREFNKRRNELLKDLI